MHRRELCSTRLAHGGGMASITRHGNGSRAQVARRGERRSKVFATKREARDWAARHELLIMNASVIAADQAFGALLDRYAREVSMTMGGGNAARSDPAVHRGLARPPAARCGAGARQPRIVIAERSVRDGAP